MTAIADAKLHKLYVDVVDHASNSSLQNVVTEALVSADIAFVRALNERLEAAEIDWSTMRDILAHGADIHKDYVAGNHKTYEDYAMRLDHAAHERLAAYRQSKERAP